MLTTSVVLLRIPQMALWWRYDGREKWIRVLWTKHCLPRQGGEFRFLQTVERHDERQLRRFTLDATLGGLRRDIARSESSAAGGDDQIDVPNVGQVDDRGLRANGVSEFSHFERDDAVNEPTSY